MKIAIVIPTYNEKENIGKIISDIFDLGRTEIGIIVVDDNSPDGTGNIVAKIAEQDARVKLISRPRKMGLGTAYLEGFRRALDSGAEYIFEMDADFSHDPKAIPGFLSAAEKNDLVIGSRYLKGVSIVNWPLQRLILSVFANKYACFVTGLKITDATSGFKCYRRHVLEQIDFKKIRSSGYAFQIEMKYRAHKKNFKLAEIPIIFIDRDAGKSKISYPIIWEALWIVWKLRLGRIK